MKRFAASLLLSGLAGCGSAPEPETSRETVHVGAGTVVDVVEGRVLIDHDAIPGFMDAMTMSFGVEDPALLQGLEVGMEVSFRVKVLDAAFVIESIEPNERSP